MCFAKSNSLNPLTIIVLILLLFARTFVIEKQPPQVLKKETKFGVVIRLVKSLLLNKFTGQEP